MQTIGTFMKRFIRLLGVGVLLYCSTAVTVQAATVMSAPNTANRSSDNMRVITSTVQSLQGETLVTRSGTYALDGVVIVDKRRSREEWKGTQVHLTFRSGQLVRATFF